MSKEGKKKKRTKNFVYVEKGETGVANMTLG